MEIKLLVLRTPDPEKLATFYRLLGCSFEHHQHGKGPWHYATTIGTTTLEIYPLTKSQNEADKNLRLGFAINNFETVLATLQQHHFQISGSPQQTDFGYMAVVQDSDGRKIELYRK